MPRKHKDEETALQSRGFAETAGAFDHAPIVHAPADDVRFAQSVDLMRSFSLIEDTAERQQVIALARRLAARLPD